jgi:hypothetical protein
MSAIRATWKDGRIIPDGPVNWPEGSRLLIEPDPAGSLEVSDAAWSNTPEAIAEWLKWCNSLEPLRVTPDEEAEADAWLRKANEYGTAGLDKAVKDIFR